MAVTKLCVCGNVLERCRCIKGHDGRPTIASPCTCAEPGPGAYVPKHFRQEA